MDYAPAARGGKLSTSVAGIAWHELAQAPVPPVAERAQTGRTEIVVVAPIADADVILDGVPHITEGGRLALAVTPGAHDLMIRHPRAGYREHQETLSVASGETVTVRPGLELDTTPKSAAPKVNPGMLKLA